MSDSLLLKLDDVHFSYRVRHSFLKTKEHPVIKGVDLEIRAGERLGIMGHNGAGKSTLLRLMAGIYSPDGGQVINYGAKVSMLSLQAGFDPRLSGWDNALLSGMLMGLSPKQARFLLPQIHDFCELGEQMDDPLGTYSSGMRTRLGFAVAIALDVDLLLIDEVLSVGDQDFQKKCSMAIAQTVDKGCAIVLVSHSPVKLKNWTDRILDFEDGRIGDAS